MNVGQVKSTHHFPFLRVILSLARDASIQPRKDKLARNMPTAFTPQCRTIMHSPRVLLLWVNALLPPLLIFTWLTHHEYRWHILAATATAHSLLLWAILHPRCQWLGPVHTHFITDQKEIWLTIDDGPCGTHTTALASDLLARGVPATFFFIGQRLESQPDVARHVLACGHTIANHSATHPRTHFWMSSARRVRREIRSGLAAIVSLRTNTPWFRPPAGHKPPALHPQLLIHQQRLLSWTTGGRDGWSADTTVTTGRILRQARPGAIILLHEGRAHSHATIIAVVEALQRHGYHFTIPSPDRVC